MAPANIVALLALLIAGCSDAYASSPAGADSASPQLQKQTRYFPCREEEKECFRNDRVYYAPHDKCYRLGTVGPCQVYEQFVGLTNRQTGSFEGHCRKVFFCNSEYKSLSQDGPCISAQPSDAASGWLRCPHNASLLLRKNHFDDEAACCAPGDCEGPPVPQPPQPGLCAPPRVKVFTSDDTYPNARNPLVGARVPCGEEELRCFAQGALPVAAGGGCAAPLAPCGDGAAWVVASRRAWDADGALVAACERPRCLPGAFFLAEARRCVPHWELQRTLCAGDNLLYDLFGSVHCARRGRQSDFFKMPQPIEGSGFCALSFGHVYSAAVGVSAPYLARDNQGNSGVSSRGNEPSIRK